MSDFVTVKNEKNGLLNARGRINNREFLLYTTISGIIYQVTIFTLGFISGYILGGTELTYSTANLIITKIIGPIIIPILFIILATIIIFLTIKRFHDIGKSGNNTRYLLIPGYNIYVLGILIFKKGEKGKNKYGNERNNLKKWKKILTILLILILLSITIYFRT